MSFLACPARSRISHLASLLPCGPGDLTYADDLRGYEDMIGRLHGGVACFEARNGVRFENAIAATSHSGVDISVHACTDAKAHFGARDKRTLVMYLAGAGSRTGEDRSFSLTAGGEALVCGAAVNVAEWRMTASLIVTFDASAVDSVLQAVSGWEGCRCPADDILIPSDVMMRNGARYVLLGATRMAFHAQSRPGFLSPASAADLVLRSIASLSMDAINLAERHSSAHDGARALVLARAYMLDRLGEDVTLSQLERIAGVSRRTLQTQFRRAYGMSPLRYLREERLKAAYRMLASGKSRVTESAYACGFTHMSQFSALFRTRFGALPSEIARRHNEAIALSGYSSRSR